MRLWRPRSRAQHEHQYRQHPVGAGLTRRHCHCGQVKIGRDSWPRIRWSARSEHPGIFVPLRPTMFLPAPLWVREPQPARPRFGERRVG